MLSYFIAYPIAAFFYLPVFHKLRLTSGYEVQVQMNDACFDHKIIFVLYNLRSSLAGTKFVKRDLE